MTAYLLTLSLGQRLALFVVLGALAWIMWHALKPSGDRDRSGVGATFYRHETGSAIADYSTTNTHDVTF